MDRCNNVVPNTMFLGKSLDLSSSLRNFLAKFGLHFFIQSNFDDNQFTISIIFFDWESVDISLLGSFGGCCGGTKMVVCSLVEVGHRYAMDVKIKQVWFVKEKHFSDLDV